jgi:site-specific DNA-methyltransferase (adenine-specific)
VATDVQLHLGDCLEFLKTLEPGSVDAVVTDPPYGIALNARYGGGSRLYPDGSRREPKHAYRPKIEGDDKPFDPAPFMGFRHVMLWGANNYGLKGGRWLVWDKRCGVCPPRSQADCEIAWFNEPGPARVFRHVWDGMIRDSERGVQREHPTQKPVALMEWCLSFLPEGCTVFDPYMGSGTTGVACIRTGRRFIGCEIDPTYFQIAERRIAAEREKTALFA